MWGCFRKVTGSLHLHAGTPPERGVFLLPGAFTLAQAAMPTSPRKTRQQNMGIDYATGYLVLKFYAFVLTTYRLPE